MGSITVLPTPEEFGAPKADDPSVVVSNPENELFRAANHAALVQRLIEYGIEIGLGNYSTANSLWRAVGNPDGSTPGSVWASVAGLASGQVTQVVWRPSEPVPSGNVYNSWANVYTAIQGVRGRVAVYIDTSLAPAVIPAGAYTLAAHELALVGSGALVGARMSIAEGATISGIVVLTIDGTVLTWSGTTPVFNVGTSGLTTVLVNSAQINGVGNAGPLFAVNTGAGQAVYLRDFACGIDTDAYEIFDVDNATGTYVFPLMPFASVSSGTFRGDGAVVVYYDSASLATVSTTQPNLTTPITVFDGASLAEADFSTRVTEVYWRPGAATGFEADTWNDVMTRIGSRTGLVRIIVDDTSGAALISNGTHALSCSELEFVTAKTSGELIDVVTDHSAFFGAGPLRRLSLDGCRFVWAGLSAPMITVASTDVFELSLRRGGTIHSDATAAEPMFDLTGTGGMNIRLEAGNVSADGNALFRVGATAVLYVYAGLVSTLGDDVMQGAGFAYGLHNSMNGSALSTVQTGVTPNAFYVTDGALLSDLDTLKRYNGMNVSQFSAAFTVGAPVTPGIVFAAGSPLGSIQLSLGTATPAGDGAIWWFDDGDVDFQSMDIHFAFSPAPGFPATDDFLLCVVVGGDDSTMTGLAFGLTKTDLRMEIVNGTALNNAATLSAVTASLSFVDFSFTGSMSGFGSFPPNGVPSLLGTGELNTLTSAAHAKGMGFVIPGVAPFTSPDWGTIVGRRVGIGLFAPAGVVDVGGLTVRMFDLIIRKNRKATR